MFQQLAGLFLVSVHLTTNKTHTHTHTNINGAHHTWLYFVANQQQQPTNLSSQSSSYTLAGLSGRKCMFLSRALLQYSSVVNRHFIHSFIHLFTIYLLLLLFFFNLKKSSHMVDYPQRRYSQIWLQVREKSTLKKKEIKILLYFGDLLEFVVYIWPFHLLWCHFFHKKFFALDFLGSPSGEGENSPPKQAFKKKKKKKKKPTTGEAEILLNRNRKYCTLYIIHVSLCQLFGLEQKRFMGGRRTHVFVKQMKAQMQQNLHLGI